MTEGESIRLSSREWLYSIRLSARPADTARIAVSQSLRFAADEDLLAAQQTVLDGFLPACREVRNLETRRS